MLGRGVAGFAQIESTMSASRTQESPPRSPLTWSRTAKTEAAVLTFIVLLPIMAGDTALVERFGTYLLLAIFAISVDLIWGYGGMFTFGHAVFFGGGG